VYSSGAGIALSLIVRRFLGFNHLTRHLSLDPVMPSSLDGMRVQTTLRGRPIEILYRVDAAGCGVNELTLNDRALSYTHDSNPHRRGAARVAIAAVTERLNDDRNRLLVRLG
jgi:CRISPR-associated protein Csx3